MQQYRTIAICMLICSLLSACGSTKKSSDNSKDTVNGGIIHYAIDMKIPGMKSMIDTAFMNYYWRGKAARNNLNMARMDMNIIYNNDSILLLTTTRRNDSIATKTSAKQFKSAMGIKELLSIDSTSETKNIAGYKTTKTVYETKTNGTLVMWCTKAMDIPLNSLQFYHDKIEGFPLRIEMQNRGRTAMIFNAVNVSKETPHDKHFQLRIPKNYDTQSFEQLKKFSNF